MMRMPKEGEAWQYRTRKYIVDSIFEDEGELWCKLLYESSGALANPRYRASHFVTPMADFSLEWEFIHMGYRNDGESESEVIEI